MAEPPSDSGDRSHDSVPSDPALRVQALESLLVEKGLVDRAALDVLVDLYESRVGPRDGAQVVARAWVDPDFKRRLLADGTAAIAELGDGSRYYEHWLAALERLVTTKGLAQPAELLDRKDAWAAAYQHTPHGEAVRLR